MQNQEPNLEPATLHFQIPCTLVPLTTQGRDALDTRRGDEIETAILRKIEYAQRGPFHEVGTRQSDDLFATVPLGQPQTSPIPADATPTAATIDFHLKDSSRTATAELRPPNTVNVRPPAHARAILAWLATSCLSLAHKLAASGPILILLAVASIFAPGFDDTDVDDDDDAEECPSPHCNRRPRFHVSRIANLSQNYSHHFAPATD
jgi:hypothetical protein